MKEALETYPWAVERSENEATRYHILKSAQR